MKLFPLISVTRGHKYRFCRFYIANCCNHIIELYVTSLEQNYHYSKKIADEIYVKEQLATANNYLYVFMNNCIHIHQFSFKITTSECLKLLLQFLSTMNMREHGIETLITISNLYYLCINFPMFFIFLFMHGSYMLLQKEYRHWYTKNSSLNIK